MTFDPSVPNASQSPGLFPPQNSTNFNRLQTIIGADHVFNNTAQTTDGVHKQVTLIARAIPVVLPAGTNAILYTALDSLGQAQLNFYNGTLNFIITPPPLRIVGTATIPASSTVTIYPDPGFFYSGSGVTNVSGSSVSSFAYIVKSGSNKSPLVADSGTGFPTFQFSGNDLQVKNNTTNPQTVFWSVTINRVN
jgi:hypothetical protein